MIIKLSPGVVLMVYVSKGFIKGTYYRAPGEMPKRREHNQQSILKSKDWNPPYIECNYLPTGTVSFCKVHPDVKSIIRRSSNNSF